MTKRLERARPRVSGAQDHGPRAKKGTDLSTVVSDEFLRRRRSASVRCSFMMTAAREKEVSMGLGA